MTYLIFFPPMTQSHFSPRRERLEHEDKLHKNRNEDG